MTASVALMKRRDCLALGKLAVSASAVVSSHAAPGGLPVPTSLPDELALALKMDSPLLVMVSLEGCPFCKIARENYLAPLQRQQGLWMVQVDMRNRQSVRDFDGTDQTQDQLIRKWGIKVAPTVLFFGRRGVEVAERLVGGYIPDFYGAYLDDRLRIAKAAIRR
jgi:thioredoxin-related protein